MAWITEKKTGGYLVRWRDESRRTRSRYFKDRAEAEAEKARHESSVLAKAVLSGPRISDYSPGVYFDDKRLGWFWPDGRPFVQPDSGRGPRPAAETEFALENYLRRMIEGNRDLRDTTRELYLRNLRVHIARTPLGEADIRSVTPEDLTTFWAKVDGIGARRNVQQLLSKAFNRALVSGVIDVNPLKRAPDVKRPARGRQEEVMPLTTREVEALADGAKYPRDRLEILVMAYGGLRAGEVGGLRVQDIDFPRCELRLRQQVVRVTGRGKYVSLLKTAAARRTVTIPCSVADELKAFLEAEPPAEDGRIFHGPNGEPRAHNAITHGVHTSARRAGLQRVFSHQLRHTAVSQWIEDGANPKDVQRMVGHSDVRETLQTYGHLFTHGGAALAESMERRRHQYRNGG